MNTNHKKTVKISAGTGIFLLISMFSLSLSVNSCNDEAFLEEKAYSFLDVSKTYSSLEGLRQGMAGCYANVRRYWYWGEEIQDPEGIMLGGLGTDVAYHGEDPSSFKWLTNYETYLVPEGPYAAQTDRNNTVFHHWRYAFELVSRANYMIMGCEEIDEGQWRSPEQKKAYIAEAKFFRAWAYRLLTALYGEVPVIDWATTGVKLDYERDPLSKAYALMESDLIAGTTDLPDKGEEEATTRINRGAAYQLLCEVYLAQKKYNEAVQAANALINNPKFTLMTESFGGKKSVWGTSDVFWDLHADGNQYNAEAIWVMPMIPNTSDGHANHRASRCWAPAYFRFQHAPDAPVELTTGNYEFIQGTTTRQTRGMWCAFRGKDLGVGVTGGESHEWDPVNDPRHFWNGISDTLSRGVAWIHPTNLTAYYIWKDNWDNDYRNARHMVYRDFYYDNPRSAFHGKKVNLKEDYKEWYPKSQGGIAEDVGRTAAIRDLQNDTCQYIFPFFMKKFDPCKAVTNSPTSGNGDSFKDIYIMRLAETYLSRAEAYIGLGQYDKAIEDINTVRRRSNAKVVTEAEAIAYSGSVLDYLLDERIRELYTEEMRHIILRRTGKFFERTVKYNNNPNVVKGTMKPGQNLMKANLLWPIPQREIEANVDNQWEQNPGYLPGHPDFRKYVQEGVDY